MRSSYPTMVNAWSTPVPHLATQALPDTPNASFVGVLAMVPHVMVPAATPIPAKPPVGKSWSPLWFHSQFFKASRPASVPVLSGKFAGLSMRLNIASYHLL